MNKLTNKKKKLKKVNGYNTRDTARFQGNML